MTDPKQLDVAIIVIINYFGHKVFLCGGYRINILACHRFKLQGRDGRVRKDATFFVPGVVTIFGTRYVTGLYYFLVPCFCFLEFNKVFFRMPLAGTCLPLKSIPL